ncbi:TonB family protein [Brucella sp. BE17]|uniref:energy transducer TonB family protein n=1 Tax=Brucella sp. BE17 TaxID=3142977 RepID=UPI0031BB89C2
MIQLPPDHPPIKVASPDAPQSSFWRDTGRWLCAGILVLSAHAAGAYVIHVTQDQDQPDGGEVAAMVVELAPEPTAPLEEQASESAQPETAEVPEEEIEPEPEPTPPEPEEVTPPEPEEPEEIVPDVVETEKAEVAVPKPVEKPEPKPEPKPKPKKVEKPKPKKAEKARETRQASAPRIDANDGAKAAANRRGQNNSASAGVSSAKWSSKLQSHMARSVRYLKRRKRDAKGRVLVNFVVDPSGNVLSARVASSSGDATVDQLAVEAARRASPVPAPPPAIAKARMAVTLPLSFE